MLLFDEFWKYDDSNTRTLMELFMHATPMQREALSHPKCLTNPFWLSDDWAMRDFYERENERKEEEFYRELAQRIKDKAEAERGQEKIPERI